MGSVLENNEGPELSGLRAIEKHHGIIDTRVNQRNLYMCEKPDNIMINVRASARNVHVIQIEQAPS
eukprot:6182258-Prorocentrum_lima.AAC.1